MRVNIYCIHNLINYNVNNTITIYKNIIKDNKDFFNKDKVLILLIYNI
jgi:hypothetical protein